MNTTPISEMNYEQVLNAIFTRYSDLNAEIRRRYLTDATRNINPLGNAARYHEWESKIQTCKAAILDANSTNDHKEELLEEAFDKFIVPYVGQYEPARQFVEIYMLLEDICDKWGIDSKLKREKLIRSVVPQTTAAFL